MIALAPSAKAQVVWSGIRDSVINVDDTISLNIDNDAAFDFKFILNGTQFYVGGWYNSSYSYGYYYYRYGQGYVINPLLYSYQNSWVARSSTWYNPLGLNAGDTINDARPYWNHSTYATYYGLLGYGSVYYFKSYYGTSVTPYKTGGDFMGNDAFLGVRFYIDDQQHYGWVRLNMSTNSDEMTVRDWAYETQPDSGIIAGGVSPLFMNEEYYNTDTVQIALTFPLSIQNLVPGDFIITNGIVSNIIEEDPGISFMIEIAATADGEVDLTLPQDSVDNSVGLVVLSKSTKFIVDTQAPHATIDAGVTTTNNKKVTVAVSFNEKITGLSLGDFIVTNGDASNLHEVTDSSEYTIDITATAGGIVGIQLPAAAVNDIAGNGNLLASESYTYNPPVSVEEITTDDVILYPNPASTTLHVKLNSDATISITNASGETVFIKEHFLAEDIDVSGFTSGIYIVQIQQDNYISHSKLIIEH
jgi:hypothetical protein